MPHGPAVLSPRARGKLRARDEGDGAADGIVLPLDLVGDGVYEAVYTVPFLIGNGPQNLSLQIDTGSADLWIAADSCSTSACSGTKGHLYDPSGSTSTSQSFSINYLIGAANGPIVWDTVQLGGYNISYQALAAATSVTNEPLQPGFSGILGLALTPDSNIANAIPPTTSDQPDGATFASNLFGISPITQAPAARFLSISLERPGSDRTPSLLGIGRHPAALVPDPSKVVYARVVSDAFGTAFWKGSLTAISVWVGGVEGVVDIGHSANGAVYPRAILDTGVPVIATTSALANAIYGAIGVGPASDGNYYVPCTTPLNMTITLNDNQVIPLHPLDLTAPSTSDPSASMCTGLIQAADSLLAGNPTASLADLILGVPFLRNTYTVMAYAVPDATGAFPPGVAQGADAQPRLGLLPLTDPATALAEFNTVRVLNQPLPPTGNGGGGGGGGAGTNAPADHARQAKGLSVGLKVLLGVGVFFALCAALFVVRWLLMRRRFRRENGQRGRGVGLGGEEDGADGDEKDAAAYALWRLAHRTPSLRGSYKSGHGPDGAADDMGMKDAAQHEEALRAERFARYKARQRRAGSAGSDAAATDTMDSALTRVDGRAEFDPYVAELGYRYPPGAGAGRTRADELDHTLISPESPDAWSPATPGSGSWRRGSRASLLPRGAAPAGLEDVPLVAITPAPGAHGQRPVSPAIHARSPSGEPLLDADGEAEAGAEAEADGVCAHAPATREGRVRHGSRAQSMALSVSSSAAAAALAQGEHPGRASESFLVLERASVGSGVGAGPRASVPGPTTGWRGSTLDRGATVATRETHASAESVAGHERVSEGR